MMFGTKKKLDPKLRFQRSDFRQQLSQARNYKRTSRVLPTTGAAVFLSKIGLGSWTARIITALFLLLIIYLVYIPNIFFVKNVNISDSDPGSLAITRDLVNSYLNKMTPWPQKNLLLLSKNGLKGFLLANSQKILSVNRIDKKFPNTLSLDLSPRVDQFLLQDGDGGLYTISNDGKITNSLLFEASSTIPSGLTKLNLQSSGPLAVGQAILRNSDINFIMQLQNQLPKQMGLGIDHLELDNLTAPSLTVYLQNGARLFFDLNTDPSEMLNRLSVLLGQMQPGDVKNLAYIDLRFKDRGYTCLKSQPCAQPAVIPQATSTPTN